VGLAVAEAHAGFDGGVVDFFADLAEVGENGGLVPAEVGVVVADEEPAAIADGAGAIEDFIDAVAGAVDPVVGFGEIEEVVALHVGGSLETGEGEDSGGEVDEGDEFVGFVTGFEKFGSEVVPFFGNADHERDLHAGVGEEAFVAGHAGAVVGVEEDDGVFGEAVGFEFGEDAANVLIHDGDAVVEASEPFADERSVGIIRGDADLAGVVDFAWGELGLDLALEDFVRPDHGAGLVGGHVIEDGEEGLAFFTGAPVGFGVGFDPGVASEAGGIGRVVVGFDVVGGVVAGGAEEFGKAFGAGGEGEGGAHLTGAGGGGIHAGDEAGA